MLHLTSKALKILYRDILFPRFKFILLKMDIEHKFFLFFSFLFRTVRKFFKRLRNCVPRGLKQRLYIDAHWSTLVICFGIHGDDRC